MLCAGNENVIEVAREGDLTALLLDMSELALCRVSNPELSGGVMAQQGSELNQLQAALSALQAALSLKLSAVPLSLDMCCDLMLLLIDVAQVSVRSFVMDSMQKRISFWLWVCRGNMLQARLAPSVAGVCLIMHGDASFGSCLTPPPPPPNHVSPVQNCGASSLPPCVHLVVIKIGSNHLPETQAVQPCLGQWHAHVSQAWRSLTHQ